MLYHLHQQCDILALNYSGTFDPQIALVSVIPVNIIQVFKRRLDSPSEWNLLKSTLATAANVRTIIYDTVPIESMRVPLQP